MLIDVLVVMFKFYTGTSVGLLGTADNNTFVTKLIAEPTSVMTFNLN